MKNDDLVLAISEIQKFLNLTSALFQSISSLFLAVLPVSNFPHKVVFSLIDMT